MDLRGAPNNLKMLDVINAKSNLITSIGASSQDL